MSETAPDNLPPLPTTAELIRFLEEKSKISACPVCTNESWLVADAPAEMNWSIPADSVTGGFTIPSPSIPVFSVVCTNCAFIRIHALRLAQTWLSQNPPKGAAS
jgi:hypothetical protein